MRIPRSEQSQIAMEPRTNRLRGEEGEKLAGDFLARKPGWRILERNWRSPADRRDEIDLICADGEALVFVEVKSRIAGSLVPGYHAVDGRKKRALRRAARAYLNGPAGSAWRTFRFDVVEVEFPPAAGAMAPVGTIPEGPGLLHFECIPLFGRHFRRG
jgi:putative endonuclease